MKMLMPAIIFFTHRAIVTAFNDEMTALESAAVRDAVKESFSGPGRHCVLLQKGSLEYEFSNVCAVFRVQIDEHSLCKTRFLLGNFRGPKEDLW